MTGDLQPTTKVMLFLARMYPTMRILVALIGLHPYTPLMDYQGDHEVLAVLTRHRSKM
jgi:hypothetical protein